MAGESTEVAVDDRTALVTGYRFPLDVPGVCTLVLHPMQHKANVVFREPGTARIVLRYRTSSHDDPFHAADGLKVYTVEVSS